MAQDRLWITDPKRTTCLATVIAVRGARFQVDKPLFAPRSTTHRHPQNHDKGTLWIAGEKRRLDSVVDDGGVWYRLRGTVPEMGATLQCELDQDTRNEASRAHTAMHLWLAELPGDAPPMTQNPEVRGGGHVRLTYAWPVAPELLAATLTRVNQRCAADAVVERRFVPRAEAVHEMTPQLFQPADPVPGGDPLPLVRIGNDCFPCDGSHVDRTGRIGSVVVSHARAGKDGFVVGLRVQAQRRRG